MSRKPSFRWQILALVAASGVMLVGCGKVHVPAASSSKGASEQARLEQEIDAGFGGVGTCMIVAETMSGRVSYRYGDHAVCMRPLPPCATFEIANDLIALDEGALTPATILKWDRKPQDVSAWQHDLNMGQAFELGVSWWDQQVARKLGAGVYARRLRDFDYGARQPLAPADSFWLGPSAGGALGISTEQQSQFIGKLFRGRLPVKAQSAAAVQAMMHDETRGGVELSDKTGSCASQADQSRQVTWWVGRLKSAVRDQVFAASLEGPSDASLPGAELAHRGKTALSAAGLWPSD